MSEALRLLIVYGLSAGFCVGIAHRFLRPLSAAIALALVLLPMVSTGAAMFKGDFYGGLNLAYHTPPLLADSHKLETPEGGFTNGPLMDQMTQVVPWRKAVRELVKNGHPPLLNRFSRGGDPLLGGSQPAPFDPKVWIGFLLPLSTAVTFACSFVLFQAALFTFLFLREYRLGELAAFFGASVWMLCGFLDFYTTWSLTSVVVTLPLLLLGLRRIARCEPGGFGAALIAWLLSLAGGHPESVLHVTTLGGLFFLAHLRSSPSLRRALGLSIAAGIAAFGLAAPIVFPFAEVLPQTSDYWMRKTFHPDPSLSWEGVTSSSMAALYPFAWGEPWTNGRAGLPERFDDASGTFVGSLALAFAIIGLFAGPPQRRGFGWFVLFSLAVALGVPWLSDLIGALPLFSISLGGRLVFATAFGLAVLAAFGFEATRRDPTRGRLAVLVATGLVLTVGAWWRLDVMLEAGMVTSFHRESIPFMLCGPLMAALAGLMWRSPRRLGLIWLGLFLLMHRAELPRFYHSFGPELFFQPLAELEELPQGEEPYRVVGRHFDMVPNQAALWEIEDIRGPSVVTNRRLAHLDEQWCERMLAFFCRADHLDSPLLDLFNVRYAVGNPKGPPTPGWPLVHRGAHLAIFENPDVLPRAFAPTELSFVRSEQSVVPAMKEATEFRSLAWIEDEQRPVQRVSNGSAKIAVRSDGPDLYLSVTSRQDFEDGRELWILVSQTFWKGWRAVAEDGRKLTVRPANHAFFAVLVPEDTSEIHLFYRPQGWVIGWAVCFATALCSVLGWLWFRRQPPFELAEERVSTAELSDGNVEVTRADAL